MPASADVDQPLLPDYGGACLSSVVPALLAEEWEVVPPWLPEPVVDASQVVLLVLDGLGWHQLAERRELAPTLSSGSGGPIRSVVPSTTATALTSLTTGASPARHGVVGYRIRHHDEILNVLRWQTERGDARRRLPPGSVQPLAPFGGRSVPVLSRGDFAATGFSAAHLGQATLVGWAVPSSLIVDVPRVLAEGHRLVYVYYDGIDKVAHQHGFGPYYDAELVAVDRLVGDLLHVLPAGACLAVTADHGQVAVGPAVRVPSAQLLDGVELLSGEGRFRWLHAKPGAAADVLDAATADHGAEAWVVSLEQVVDEGWLGDAVPPAVLERLGDVAVVARAPMALLDPADTGETRLACRHGSLTPAEMEVPLVAWRSA